MRPIVRKGNTIIITANNASIPMPHPVVEKANREDDLHTVKEEATLDHLGLRKLLFIDRVGSWRSPCS